MNSSFFNRLSTKEQAVLARRLSFLIRAHVPILEALSILRKQAHAKTRQHMFDEIILDVSNGQLLSASLEKFRDLFGSFTIDIIRVGEEGGILDENLNYLADELQKQQDLQQKIIGAMVYPATVTVATLGITGLITIYVFPKILPVFKALHVDLPFSTRALIWMSTLVVDYGIFIGLGAILAAIMGAISYTRSLGFRRCIHRGALHTPLLGRLLKDSSIATMCRTLGMLLKSHFTLIRAVQITADTSASLVYREALSGLAEDSAKGRHIAPFLEQRPDLFPSMVTEMIAIGETTGNLSDTLLYLSDYYENEVDSTIKHLSSSLEPILMVLMGVIVGFIALSVITPIYAITQNLNH